MSLVKVIPDMGKTFGELSFAGAGKVNRRRGEIVSRTYHLFSDVQAADDVTVTIPASTGDKHFEYEEVIELVNPELIVVGRKVRNNAYSVYELTAENIVKAGKQ